MFIAPTSAAEADFSSPLSTRTEKIGSQLKKENEKKMLDDSRSREIGNSFDDSSCFTADFTDNLS